MTRWKNLTVHQNFTQRINVEMLLFKFFRQSNLATWVGQAQKTLNFGCHRRK